MITSSDKNEEVQAEADLESIWEWFAYNIKKKYLKVLETLSSEQLTKETQEWLRTPYDWSRGQTRN